METVEVLKIYANDVWVESDFCGGKHVMIQSQMPGTEPFCYCSFNYDYAYTSNASIRHAASSMALALGATEPVEFRERGLGG